jgi:hypothetical protein
MLKTQTVVMAILALLLTGAAAGAQPAGNAAPPAYAPNPNAPPPDLDQQCRRQAAQQTGYGSGSGSGSERAYGSAYYACMDSADNAPPPPGYGPPPPGYGPPPPGYYGAPYPYPYPYSYYGPYYGSPAIGLSFGFGGRGGRR